MLRKFFSLIVKLIWKDFFQREFGFFPSGRDPSQAERQTVSRHFDCLLRQFEWAERRVYEAQDDVGTGGTKALKVYRRRESDFYAAQGYLKRALELAEKFGFKAQVDWLIRFRIKKEIEPTRPYQVLGTIS